MQFLSVFAPENLKAQVQNYVRNENIQQSLPKKSNVKLITMTGLDHSQQNKSPFDGAPNMIKKQLERTQSQSQRYSQPQPFNKSQRHNKSGLTAYNDLYALAAGEENGENRRFNVDDDDEGTVDDLDEIDLAEDYEEEEEFDSSIRAFINDGGDASRDNYSPVDYFMVNNREHQYFGEKNVQNGLTQQEQSEWTLGDSITDTRLSQSALLRGEVPRSQISTIRTADMEPSEDLMDQQDLDALKNLGQIEQNSIKRNFYADLCRINPEISQEDIQVFANWLRSAAIDHGTGTFKTTESSETPSQEVARLVTTYDRQVCFSSPTAGRMAMLLLNYSTQFDDKNRFFVNDVLFQAFSGIFYRLQISQTCVEYVTFFHEKIAPFIPETGGEMQFLQNDFNLPLLRVLKIIDSVSCSHFQFCVPPTLAERGIEARTNFLLSKLGVKIQTAYMSYGELQSKARRDFRIKYQQLRKSIKFRLFTPNFLYKAHFKQLTAQDFAYLLEILPQHFKMLNYQQAYFKLLAIKDSIYQLLPQYLQQNIRIVDRQNYQYANNFVLFQNVQRRLPSLQLFRLGAFIENKVIFTTKGVFTSFQSEAEKHYFVLGHLDGCQSFVPLKLQKHRKDVQELSHFITTFIFNEAEIFIKYNGVTWLGGFLGSKFISNEISDLNRVVCDEFRRKQIEAFMQQKIQ